MLQNVNEGCLLLKLNDHALDNGKSSIKAAGEPKCNPFGGPASSFGHEAVVISVVRGGR